MSDPDPFKDAEEAYRRSMEMCELVRAEWVAQDRPLVLVKPSGLEAVHPLWTILVASEEHANRFRVELGQTPRSAKAAIRRGRGRPPGSVSARDRVAQYEMREPPVVLRVAKRSVPGDGIA